MKFNIIVDRVGNETLRLLVSFRAAYYHTILSILSLCDFPPFGERSAWINFLRKRERINNNGSNKWAHTIRSLGLTSNKKASMIMTRQQCCLTIVSWIADWYLFFFCFSYRCVVVHLACVTFQRRTKSVRIRCTVM